MTAVRVRFLGTGDPFADGGRMQSCILLEGGPGRLLLDCGATSLLAMERFGIDPASIDAVVVSHFHGDHIGGLPFLIMESRFNVEQGWGRPARARPLLVAGPPGTEERVRRMTELLAYESAFTQMVERGMLAFVTLAPGLERTVGAASVAAFPVRHTPEAIALRVSYGGRTIAYSGDTAWTDALLQVAADADLFICQVYTFDLPTDSMLSYRVLREHRAALTCRRMVLTHIGGDMQQHIAELTDDVAEDGMTIAL